MLGSRHVAPAKLVAYMDNELSPEETAAVADHLTACKSCYEKALQQRRTKDLLHQAVLSSDNLPNSAGIAVNTLQSALQSAQETGHLRTRPNVLSVLVGLVLTFVVIYGVQSLVTDVLSHDEDAGNSRVAAYVEDHLSFTDAYQVANSSGLW